MWKYVWSEYFAKFPWNWLFILKSYTSTWYNGPTKSVDMKSKIRSYFSEKSIFFASNQPFCYLNKLLFTVWNSTIKRDHFKKISWNQLSSNFFSKKGVLVKYTKGILHQPIHQVYIGKIHQASNWHLDYLVKYTKLLQTPGHLCFHNLIAAKLLESEYHFIHSLFSRNFCKSKKSTYQKYHLISRNFQ